ncbi:N-alpha-acetyltransferase 15, NatA auxiliary subunit-like 2 [Homarus americanus]|uniref:N-alpha-acetyltransferase 15, NatA auxiliary subunit-like 2 n=2 Tax=Homarus americanus TaxID=6706 RepID=A0A8J5NER9_HOMAM|nr:N-alpha-acetyltransferase 15, NatA auxiliary subunit-like 2 [Homarus americanus]
MAFEIYLRKGKPLLMLQALKRALKLEPTNPELHTCLIRFLQYRQDKLTNQCGTIVDVINREVTRLLPTTEPNKLNEDFLNNNQESLPHRLQAARSMVLLDSVQRERALSIATILDSHLHDRTHQNTQQVLEWMESREFGATPEQLSHYKAQCHAIYPRARAFCPPQPASTSSTSDSTSDSTTTTTITTTSSTANHNHVDSPSS